MFNYDNLESKFSERSAQFLEEDGITIFKEDSGVVVVTIGELKISYSDGKYSIDETNSKFFARVASEFIETIRPYGTLIDFYNWHYINRNKNTNPYKLHLVR